MNQPAVSLLSIGHAHVSGVKKASGEVIYAGLNREERYPEMVYSKECERFKRQASPFPTASAYIIIKDRDH